MSPLNKKKKEGFVFLPRSDGVRRQMRGGGGVLSADANASKDTSLTCSISTLRGQKEKIEEDLTGNAPASNT